MELTPFGWKVRTKKATASKLLNKMYFVPQEQLGELCREKRAFYRAVSGLHASITIHLSSRYPKHLMKDKNPTAGNSKPPPPNGFPAPLFGGGGSGSKSAPGRQKSADEFGPNLDLFLSRFDPDLTHGRGPFWLKNLYFVYLLELRAILKAKPFLEQQTFYTGNLEEDEETRVAVAELLKIVESFPNHYDETRLFNSAGDGENSAEINSRLKAEFKDHFRNVSRVMDCVSCDKCKLWGKLQTTGLGTALKILFTDEQSTKQEFRLSRNEVVALFNAFGRISTSIQQLENFRKELRNKMETQPPPRAAFSSDFAKKKIEL